MDLDQFQARLRKFDALRDSDEICKKTVPHTEPTHASGWPEELDHRVRGALIQSGITRPYQHQYEAIVRSLKGHDVVLESPTASGKTLAFAAPMLHTLVQNPTSFALMIYPMKALALDQMEQIKHLCDSLRISIKTYDGDTPQQEKKLIRIKPPRILITNPDMLHFSFMGWHGSWSRDLRNLQFVVIDEMHEYRGHFGVNVALLLRRFNRFLSQNRLCDSTRFFLSTATCANAKEHAQNLTGQEKFLVDATDIFKPQRNFLFVRLKDVPEHRHREILRWRIEQAALAMLEQGVQTLIFGPSKRMLEQAYYECQQKAKEKRLPAEKLALFHADLNKQQKHKTQKKIKSGEIDIIFSSNALELGLDIGGLDCVVLAGFPRSILNAWQQIGRAGRGWDRDAYVLFYAMNDPIDRYFVGDIDAFINKPLDHLIVDPNNKDLIEKHLPMLAMETERSLQASDKHLLGEAFYDHALREMDNLPRNSRPHQRLEMRGGFGKTIKLKFEEEEIGQLSEERRFREAYIDAIFMFDGVKYRVHSHERDAIVLVKEESNLRTDAGFFTTIDIREYFKGYRYKDIDLYYGSLDIQTRFTGYTVVHETSGEKIETIEAPEARYLPQNNLHAFWVQFPDSNHAQAGIGALEHLFRIGSLFVLNIDRYDINSISSQKDSKEGQTAYIYENYGGGIGAAKQLFNVWEEAMERGIEVALACKCSNGCPDCIEPAKSYSISNPDIEKKKGIELAWNLQNIKKSEPRKILQPNGRFVLEN